MKNYFLKFTLLLATTFCVFCACNTDKKETEKTYIITYEINEGKGTTPAPQSFQTNGDPVMLNNGSGLSKSGFAFGGWSEKVGGTVVSSPYAPTGNVTLHAIWIPVIYAVAYNLNEGMGATPAPQYYSYGGKPINLNNGAGLSKEGFDFGGWSEKDGGARVPDPYTPEKSLTLYAIWNAVAPCMIAYDLNGGTGTIPLQQLYRHRGTPVTLNTGTGLTKTGFAFGGWAMTTAGDTPVSNPYAPATNVTLYAIWIPVYAVSYDLNGGTGLPLPPQTYTQGGMPIALSNGAGLTKTGFTFGGWAITAADKIPVNNYYAPAANVTLYAIWIPV